MTPRYNLFFAALPPPPLARPVHGLASRLGGGKPVAETRLHVTLFNMTLEGNAPRTAIDQARCAMGRIRLPPVRIIFDRIIANASSTALCPSEVIPALADHQHRLAAAIRAELPWVPRFRFSPHMTLLYPSRRHPGTPYSIFVDPVSWQATDIVLILSHVGHTRHDLVDRWPLDGEARQPMAGAGNAQSIG